MRELDGDGRTTHTRSSDSFALLHTVGILVFWLCSNLLILVSIFFLLREQTSRVSRKEMLESTRSSYSSQGIIYHLPFSSLKERKALISSTRIMGMNLNSRISALRETRRVNHIIMELNFILPFRASCSLFPQRIGERFWDFTREVFPVLHDSVVHLMSR